MHTHTLSISRARFGSSCASYLYFGFVGWCGGRCFLSPFRFSTGHAAPAAGATNSRASALPPSAIRTHTHTINNHIYIYTRAETKSASGFVCTQRWKGTCFVVLCSGIESWANIGRKCTARSIELICIRLLWCTSESSWEIIMLGGTPSARLTEWSVSMQNWTPRCLICSWGILFWIFSWPC